MASPPDPPKPPVLTVVSDTAIRLAWGGDKDNNGAAINDREFWGSPTTTPQFSRDGVDNYLWEGLDRGTKYYFWARTHNAEGWSAFSSRVTVTTFDRPDAPSSPALSSIKQTTAIAKVTANGDGGTPVTDFIISYGTNKSASQIDRGSYGTLLLEHLQPATTYYIKARAFNHVGFSPWSAIRSFRTIAGAYVKVGGVQKEAVPYVKVNGVWRIARGWSKIAGVWSETT